METLRNISHNMRNRFNEKYEPQVRDHLSKVYMVMASATGMGSVGVFLQMSNIFDFGGFAACCALVLVLGLHFYKDDGKNYFPRLMMLLAFGFFSGQTLGQPLQTALSIDLNVILTALGGTFVTFISLSLAALLAERGKYLFLGGLLSVIINTMGIVVLLNIFLQIHIIQLAQLYVGIFIMAALVLFDTQNIIEKCRSGNKDVIQHGMELFCDILSLFRRLLVILTQKEQRKRDSVQQKRK